MYAQNPTETEQRINREQQDRLQWWRDRSKRFVATPRKLAD